MDQATFTAVERPAGADRVVMQIKGKPEAATMFAVRPEIIKQEVPQPVELLELLELLVDEPTEPDDAS